LLCIDKSFYVYVMYFIARTRVGTATQKKRYDVYALYSSIHVDS